jgi:hypothetical protein
MTGEPGSPLPAESYRDETKTVLLPLTGQEKRGEIKK